MKKIVSSIFLYGCIFLLSWGYAQELMVESDSSAPETLESETVIFKNPFKSVLPVKEQKILESVPVGISQPGFETSEKPPVLAPTLNVTGLVWNTDRPQAIVNNRVVEIGDRIEGSEVLNIQRYGIEILYQEQRFTVGLGQKYEQDYIP